MLEPAISLCLTSIAEIKLAPSHIVKFPWAQAALRRISMAKHSLLLPTAKHMVGMEKGSQRAKSEFAHLRCEV